MSSTTKTTTVTVSTEVFRAWRRWLEPRMHGSRHGDVYLALEATQLYHQLGACAGAAYKAAMEQWREENSKSGNRLSWSTLPVGAVVNIQRAGARPDIWEDNEDFADQSVELVHDTYGGEPADLVAKVAAFTGIPTE